ncbi:MAG: HD domain-containing phosphohydrolase [bacterium]
MKEEIEKVIRNISVAFGAPIRVLKIEDLPRNDAIGISNGPNSKVKLIGYPSGLFRFLIPVASGKEKPEFVVTGYAIVSAGAESPRGDIPEAIKLKDRPALEALLRLIKADVDTAARGQRGEGGAAGENDRRLSLIYQISVAAMVGNPQTDFVLGSIVRAFDLKKGYIIYVENDSSLSIIESYYNPRAESHSGDEWSYEKRIALNTAKSRRCMLFKDARGQRDNAILCVPIKMKGNVYGVILLVADDRARTFDVGDAQVISIVAAYMASAMEIEALDRDFQSLFLSVIHTLASAIDARDHYTRGHSERINVLSLVILNEMEASLNLNFPPSFRETLQLVALLHDIGKIGTMEGILNKPDRLTDMEYEEIKKHPVVGKQILEQIDRLKDAIPGVYHHHEHYDGSGYPDGLRGDEIPLTARIVAVADAFDVMVGGRNYREKISVDKAMEEIKLQAGKQFDPQVVEHFFRGYRANEELLRDILEACGNPIL